MHYLILDFLDQFYASISYIKYRVFPLRNKENFETWVINRFGKELYKYFLNLTVKNYGALNVIS